MSPDQSGVRSRAILHGSSSRAVESAPIAKTPTDFLWVNQDEDSQDRTAARAKQAFIRTRYHRRKKEIQLQNLKTVKPFPTDNRGSQEGLVPIAHTPVVGQATNLDILDGVLSLSLHTDQNTNLYFHHFKFHTSKAYLPLYSDGLKVSLLQMAFAEPAMLKIFLSISAYHRAISLSLRDAPPQTIQKTVQDGLQLRGDAIKSVRQVLGQPGYRYPEAILIAMVHLLYIEGAEGNVGAVDAHMNGIKRIIEVLGGVDNLGYRAETLVYCCDLMKGLLGSPLSFSLSAKWEHEARERSAFFKANDHCEIILFGSRFFNSSWSQDLDAGLKAILQSFQPICLYFESQSDEMPSRPVPSEHGYVVLLAHRLLVLERRSLPPFQETVRLSIQAYKATRLWKFDGMACAEATAAKFRQCLDENLHIIQRTDLDLLFWMLFIGSLAAHEPGCFAWFLQHLKETARQLQVDDWRSAESILQGFFFVSRTLNEPAKLLWNSMVQDALTV